MVNDLIFGGVKSSDYGIHISGEGVFNAPERDTEVITIPGRSGSFLLDRGRFENIEVTYPAYCYCDTYEHFADTIAAYRNAIASQIGYQRLEDTIHPDEYRIGAFISGLEVDPIMYNSGATFAITFECKPQRYLTSGEEKKVLGTWGDTETKTGEIVELDNDGTLEVKSAEVALEPQQDLNGYDKPWAGGNGKNLFPLPTSAITQSGVTVEATSDGEIWVHGTPTITSGYISFALPSVVESIVGKIVQVSINEKTVGVGVAVGSGNGSLNLTLADTATLKNGEYTSGTRTPVVNVRYDVGAINKKYKIQLEVGITQTTWEPYTNICPITGASDVDVNVADDYDDPQTLNTYTTSLGTTVYGGSVDVIAGTGTVTMASVDLGTLDWAKTATASGSYRFYSTDLASVIKAVSSTSAIGNMICSQYETVSFDTANANNNGIYVHTNKSIGIYDSSKASMSATDFKTAMSGVQLVYELATPTTLTLTPADVELIEGTNYVFSPQGEITLEYGTNPNYIVNPTLFGCGPLIEAKGYGDIQFNGYTIKLANGAIGTVNLWQETRGGAFNGSITKTFVTGQFEPTDTFSFTVTHMFTLFEDYPSITNTNANAVNDFRDNNDGSVTYWIDLPCTFTVGTTGQITNTSTYDFGYGKKLIADMDVSYDSTTGTVVYTVATTTQGQPSIAGTMHGFYISGCNAVSTLNRLGDPTYIDCDLGEAYKINDGDVVSLNSFVDLGSKLPELVPGNNEFTVSNTFTEVAVTPRWWTV